MGEAEYRISPKQLRRMIILETGSIGCLFVTMWSGKENGILTVMLSIIGSLIYGGILMAIGRIDGGFFAMTERSMNGFLWRIAWLIYVLRFAIRGAWILSYMEFLIRETLFDGSRLMILLPLLAICGYAGMRNLEGRARFVELLFWWVVLPLVLLFVVGLWKADFISVLPREPIRFQELMVGDYHLMVLFLPLELLLFRMSASEGSDKKVWANGMRGILLAGLWVLLVYLVTDGMLGSNWGHDTLLGVTDAMELISIKSGGLERLDILMILFWLVGGIVTLSGYLFQGQQLLRRCLPFGKYYGVAAVWMTFAILAIYFCFSTAWEWSEWYLQYACIIDFPISIVLPLIIWLLYRMKYRKENRRLLKQQTEKAVKEFCGCLLLVSVLFHLTGCTQRPSIEERTYVESIHITPDVNGYQYQCMLVYVDTQSPEYVTVAEDIEEFNQEYTCMTGGKLDYSHLQGIYLSESLYEPKVAEDVLEDIREETQAVLSTPIYQDGLEIGEQKNETLGDWLKAAREQIV